MDIVQQLRDLGLFVYHSDNRYDIGKPGDQYSIQEITKFIETEDAIPVSMFVKGQLVSIGRQDDGGWGMGQRRYIPGPGPTDFEKHYASEDQVLDAALEYFIGEPTIVDGWVVPFHRHPELDKDQTLNAIHNATEITVSEFEYVQKLRFLATSGDDFWSRAFKRLFLDFPHQTNEQLVLYLRRDAQEAFIVAQAADED